MQVGLGAEGQAEHRCHFPHLKPGYKKGGSHWYIRWPCTSLKKRASPNVSTTNAYRAKKKVPHSQEMHSLYEISVLLSLPILPCSSQATADREKLGSWFQELHPSHFH